MVKVVFVAFISSRILFALLFIYAIVFSLLLMFHGYRSLTGKLRALHINNIVCIIYLININD